MIEKQFTKAIKNLQEFKDKELKKIDTVVSILTDKEFNFGAIGFKFSEQYIELLEMASGDKYNWISWFVFDNDFGRKSLEAGINGEMKSIKTIKQLFKLINEPQINKK